MRRYISTVLARIAELEAASQELYSFYAEIFEEQEDVAKVFREMKREEEAHKNQALFQKRVVDKNSSEFSPVDVEIDGITKLIKEIESHISGGVFDIGDAVDFAIHLEENAIEVHYRTWAAKLCPELTQLTRFLLRGDDHHVQKLRDLEKLARRDP